MKKRAKKIAHFRVKRSLMKKSLLGPSMGRSVAYEPGLIEDLKDLDFAAEYLSSCTDSDGDPDEEFEIFFRALEQIVKAQGVDNVAERMELKRDTVYKMFRHQNPTYRNLAKLLHAIGLGISIVVLPGLTAKRA
jgi:probable addiction module antidote protein